MNLSPLSFLPHTGHISIGIGIGIGKGAYRYLYGISVKVRIGRWLSQCFNYYRLPQNWAICRFTETRIYSFLHYFSFQSMKRGAAKSAILSRKQFSTFQAKYNCSSLLSIVNRFITRNEKKISSNNGVMLAVNTYSFQHARVHVGQKSVGKLNAENNFFHIVILLRWLSRRQLNWKHEKSTLLESGEIK